MFQDKVKVPPENKKVFSFQGKKQIFDTHSALTFFKPKYYTLFYKSVYMWTLPTTPFLKGDYSSSVLPFYTPNNSHIYTIKIPTIHNFS